MSQQVFVLARAEGRVPFKPVMDNVDDREQNQ